jgi:hypothetical protein
MTELQAWVFVVSLGFGIGTAISARIRQRNAMFWFVIGAALPVFGWLALGISEQSARRECPHCHGLIKKTATICSFCRSSI